MVNTRILTAAALLASLAAPAWADAPTAEQRIRIETALRGMGFERWGGIESDNNGREWEVDDARAADGREFDVRLNASDLSEISRKGDSPSTEQRAQIEGKLRALGFVSWSEIEGKRRGQEWGIEDARTAAGQQFDLRLAANDLRELSRKAE